MLIVASRWRLATGDGSGVWLQPKCRPRIQHLRPGAHPVTMAELVRNVDQSKLQKFKQVCPAVKWHHACVRDSAGPTAHCVQLGMHATWLQAMHIRRCAQIMERVYGAVDGDAASWKPAPLKEHGSPRYLWTDAFGEAVLYFSRDLPSFIMPLYS